MTDARPAASVEYIEGKGCIRRVQCPLKYHPTTSNFIGLSENGWVSESLIERRLRVPEALAKWLLTELT